MGENQEPVEACLDAGSSNIFPKNVKGLLLQSPKHYHYLWKNTRVYLATEAISATTTAHCFRNQKQLPNTERGLPVFRKTTYVNLKKKKKKAQKNNTRKQNTPNFRFLMNYSGT